MKSFRIFAAALAAAGLGAGVSATTANAVPAPQPYTCSNQFLGGGTYGPLTVKGWCAIDDETVVVKGDVTISNGAEFYLYNSATLRVHGNLNEQSGGYFWGDNNTTTTVGTSTAPGNVGVGASAWLFADSSGQTFHVYGTLNASNNSFVALGCTAAHPCEGSVESDAASASIAQAPAANSVTIGGNLFLAQVRNATIDGAHVGGNVIVSGGGTTAYNLDPNGGYMPIKDNTIGGSLTVSGFHGNWFGVIRNNIGGNTSITGNSGNEDSTEVVSNQIGGSLVCAGNTPHAQFGDAVEGPGYGKNYVGGQAVGECAALTKNPVSVG